MIYPLLQADPVVQVGEKFRISAEKSFITQDTVAAVTQVRMRAGAALPWVTVHLTADPTDKNFWLLDWVYDTAGAQTYEVEITAGTAVTKTGTVMVKTAAEEMLFSGDENLVSEEPEILRWLPVGRSTFNYAHRRVQELILQELDKMRIFARDGSKITASMVIDKTEVRDWATYKALAMIYSGSFSNDLNDHFQAKAKHYRSKEETYATYALNFLRLDYNKDGVQDEVKEATDMRSVVMLKR